VLGNRLSSGAIQERAVRDSRSRHRVAYIPQSQDLLELQELLRSAAKPFAEPIPAAYMPFNERTQDGREMGGAYSGLLNAAIQSIVQVKQEKASTASSVANRPGFAARGEGGAVSWQGL
jgi:hypothetical protein